MNNPQLTPHFLRGSNDARSYPKKTSICQRWFKFTQKFQGIQKSNIFARKSIESIVVVFFRTISDPKTSKRIGMFVGGPTTPHKDGGGEYSGFSGAEKSTRFSMPQGFASILVTNFRNLQEIRFVPFVFIFKKTLDVMDVIKLTLRFKFKSVFFVVGISLPMSHWHLHCFHQTFEREALKWLTRPPGSRRDVFSSRRSGTAFDVGGRPP